MRALGKALARRLPIVRSLIGRGGAASAERDTALTTLPSGDPRAVTAPIKRYSPPTEYCKIATPEDIFYCFRLFLGSNHPSDPSQWADNCCNQAIELTEEYAQR